MPAICIPEQQVQYTIEEHEAYLLNIVRLVGESFSVIRRAPVLNNITAFSLPSHPSVSIITSKSEQNVGG